MAEKATQEPSGSDGEDEKGHSEAAGSRSEASATHKTENLVSLNSEELDEVEE